MFSDVLNFFNVAPRELLLGILAIIISLTLVIALLIFNIFRRKQAEEELRDYRNQLEEMVKERTTELEDANQQLQKEIAERKHVEEALQINEARLRLNEARLRQIIDLVPHRIFVKDKDGCFILANRATAEAYGITPEDIVGKSYVELTGVEPEYPQSLENDRKVIDSRQPLFIPEETSTAPDGQVRIAQVTKIPYIVSGTDKPAVLGIAIDITDLKQGEKALAEERLLLRTVIDNLPDYIFVKNAKGRFVLNNLAHAHLMGSANPDELIGKAESDFLPKEVVEQSQITDQEVIQSGQPVFNREEWIIEPSGKKQWLLSTKIPLRNNRGEIIGLVGINRDNTERKRADETYQQHTRELNLLNHMGNLLQACNTEEDAYRVMGSICKLLFPADSGYLGIMNASRTELNVVVSWGELHPDTQTFGVNDCWALRLDTAHFIEHPDTGLLCTHLDVFPDDGYLCAPISTIDDTVGIFHLRFGPFNSMYSPDEHKQIKESKRMMVTRVVRHYALFIINLRLRQTLKREAIRDPLTGLYNRRHMEASLEREAHRAERLHTPVGLVMLDVDHFKLFNDTYGHEAGDIILRELGNLLRSSIRGEDIACRYGGEEFLLILPDASLNSVMERAKEIRKKAKDLRIAYQNEELSVTISAGVAMLPNHGPNIEDALKAADEALYQAKAEGRDRVVAAPS
jgi:diguanylate cyclase (GGDEF)-like protein/PAS domain S-box-containing protein